LAAAQVGIINVLRFDSPVEAREARPMTNARRWCALALGLSLAGLAESARAAEPAPPEKIDYLQQVKPLLAARCFSCHGALKQESELRLDTADAIRSGGSSGPAIVPGNSGASGLVLALRGEGDRTRMPAEGAPLTEEEIARIATWIDQGAEAPPEQPPPDPRKHWAYRPPLRPEVPAASGATNVRTPIDAFLAARHESLGLSPRPEAPPQVLLRRLFLDLTGLPPTRDELHAWLADPSDAAYERLVDDLLARPQYGERWGRHWMDVWRYSDWDGYGAEIRESQPHIWRWRDWIVESLNANKPYDRMILEMLAGDEIAPTDEQTLRATGYLGRNWYKFNRNVWLENTVEHAGKAFLGLTLNCARCHDHM
jgi:mono/diheme cytochrome c family protein